MVLRAAGKHLRKGTLSARSTSAEPSGVLLSQLQFVPTALGASAVFSHMRSVSSSVSGAGEVFNKYLPNESMEKAGTSRIALVKRISKFFYIKKM